LRKSQSLDEFFVGSGLLDWIQILALDIFYQRKLQDFVVRYISQHHRNSSESGQLRCPPTPLAGYKLKSRTLSAD
jgi:hypothetical protein